MAIAKELELNERRKIMAGAGPAGGGGEANPDNDGTPDMVIDESLLL